MQQECCSAEILCSIEASSPVMPTITSQSPRTSVESAPGNIKVLAWYMEGIANRSIAGSIISSFLTKVGGY